MFHADKKSIRWHLWALPTALVLVYSCTSKPIHQPTNSLDLFTAWFITPSIISHNALATASLSQKSIDSLAASIRAQHDHDSGACSTVVVDSASLMYSLGWKPPKAFNKDSLYPLIIYLHGGTGTTRTDKGTTAYTMLSQIADSMRVFLASPSSNRMAPFWSPVGQYRILQTIRHMQLWYPIDPKKIFLVGVSDGATACYAAANTIFEPFAGFVAISGFGGMLPRIGIPIIPENLMQRPIYNISAGNDRLYPAEATHQFITWLTEHNVPVEAKVYEHEEHGFDYRAQEIPTIINKLKAWSKPDSKSVVAGILPNYAARVPHVLSLISQSTSSQGSLQVFWKGDTLYCKSAGLNQAKLYFTTATVAATIPCVINNKKITISAHPGSAQDYFMLAQATQNPYVNPEQFQLLAIHFNQ